MIRQISINTKSLTPALAKEFATMNSVPGERDLKPIRLANIKAKLESGLFHSPKWAIAYCKGVKYRVNGRHSSTVLSDCNGLFPTGMIVVIEEFACDTEHDLAELFEQFDSPISIRNEHERLNAHAKTEPSLNDVPISAVRRAVDGIATEYQTREGKRISKADRARLVHTEKNQDFIRWFSVIYSDPIMALSSVAGAVYATYLKDSAVALEFWQYVISESHPESSNPTRVLSRFLRETRAQKLPSQAASKRYAALNVYERCIHAWNCYRRNQSMSLSRAYVNKKGGAVRPV